MTGQSPFPTTFQLMRLSMQYSMMMAEAQIVITMRLLGMMGLWRVSPSETVRMTSEKMSALGEATLASSRALLAGQPPGAIADAALKPVRRKTAANARRRARRGPGKP